MHNQVAAQSTNNTTTSSSTTTTVKPGNSPTNTTTLITSRTLTSTSTSTSSTSTTSTSTTTSRHPTTSITTSTTTSTPLAECDIRWPRRPAQPRGYVLIKGTRYYYGDTLYVKSGYTFRVSATICNYGSVTWDGNNYLYMRLWKNGIVVYGYAEGLGPFPPGGSSSCRTVTNSNPFTVRQNSRLQIEFVGESANNKVCKSEIIIYFQLIE